jgi:hypothetical protein
LPVAPRSRLPRLRARLLVVPLALAATSGCDGSARAFASTPAAARAQVQDLFGGLGLRFVDVQRTPKFAAARGKLARYALSPSRLWPDSAVWTGSTGAARLLELDGRSDGRRYTFAATPAVPAPDRPGDARHLIRLGRLGDGEWIWNTTVEHAVGQVRAVDVAAAMTAGIAAFTRAPADMRPTLRSGFPRTAAALGRLLRLEEARSTPLADGSRLVELRGRFDTARLKTTMPAFAAYVDKWVHPSKMTFALTDPRGADGGAKGARWLEVRLADDLLTVRLRARADGELLALEGPARPMPDTVQFRTDAKVHYLMFDVGVSGLAGEMSAMRTPRERGWAIRWKRPPQWHLPLGVRHLVSGTLDRPFVQEGMLLRLAFRDAEPGQTVLVRRFDVAIKESAIVRWLGGLGSKAMDDFAGRAEAEENRFTADLLFALRGDRTATLPGASAGDAEADADR